MSPRDSSGPRDAGRVQNWKIEGRDWNEPATEVNKRYTSPGRGPAL